MTKKLLAKLKVTPREKIKRFFLRGRANKKAVLIGAIIIILIFVFGAGAAYWKTQKYIHSDAGRYGNMTKYYSASVAQSNNGNGFILPDDALKSGEIAIVVDDLDVAKDGVQNIAAKNGGVVYSTFIAYASDSMKNGSIVVQVPNENFDTTFSELKKISSRVVQEATRQIPLRSPVIMYPQPMAETADALKESEDEKNKTTEQDETAVDSVIAPAPSYLQTTQNKGYIKVVFADYEKNSAVVKTNVGNMIGIGYYGQNMRDNKWVVLAVKSIVLIVLIAIIVIITKKIVSNLQKIKRNKPTVHVVKQAIRTRKRTVRAKKK